MTIFSSVTLHSARQPPIIAVPSLAGVPCRTGHHVYGRYNGSWVESSDIEPTEIYLPQRYKRVAVTSTAEVPKLVEELETLDSRYEGARQLYKLHRLITAVESSFAASVNICSTSQDLTSGSFYVLSSKVPIYVNLVIDLTDHSTQLVWATFDFKAEMQASGMLNYVFYPFPVLIDRPLFVHTQNTCSKWWKLLKTFNGPFQYIRAANALELYLYKSPEIEKLP